MSRGFFSKRNLAIIFGAALVLTVAITAAAVGVGHPSVPSDDVAVIDDASIDVPGLVEDGHISKTNFNRFLLQTAKQNNLQQVPQPSDPQYKQLKDQAMQSALQIGWIVGEAEQAGAHLHGHADSAVAAADQVTVQDPAGVRAPRATRRA